MTKTLPLTKIIRELRFFIRYDKISQIGAAHVSTAQKVFQFIFEFWLRRKIYGRQKIIPLRSRRRCNYEK